MGLSRLPNRICIFFVVACVVSALVDSSKTYASCGDYLLNSSGQQLNHSPSPRFLAELIGVAELRMPWQADRPCNSPHCQKSSSGKIGLTISLPSHRNATVTCAIGFEMSLPETLVTGAKRLSNECRLATGYVEEILRPPKSGVMVAAISRVILTAADLRESSFRGL